MRWQIKRGGSLEDRSQKSEVRSRESGYSSQNIKVSSLLTFIFWLLYPVWRFKNDCPRHLIVR